MGGEEHWRAVGGTGPAGSLGFTFHRVPDDAPVGGGQSIPVGLRGIFEGYVPPFHATIEDAVDAVASLRSSDQGLAPWRNASIVAGIPGPSEEAIAATKLLASYIWDRYGRFPATIDPVLTTVWYQAHHLDVDFYDRYYPRAAVPDHIRNHLRDWHEVVER
jgi:hypothetical protein